MANVNTRMRQCKVPADAEVNGANTLLSNFNEWVSPSIAGTLYSGNSTKSYKQLGLG
jgi:hypothetical protein